MTTNSI